jgi:phosphodiesterase/alkaline phosphatase D-like protein
MSRNAFSESSSRQVHRGLRKKMLPMPAREAMLHRCAMEALETRQLLSANIPLYNGDFESSTVWVSTSSSTVGQETVAPGQQGSWNAYQPANSNLLDPRFGTPGWAKTAQGGGGPGENTEGIYSELNDTGSNTALYYPLVGGQLAAPADGTNVLNIVPANGATYNIWVDQNPDTGSSLPGDSLSHYATNYPAMIAATTAIAGHTYQVTAAYGNPLINGAAGLGATVEMDFTIGAGTYYEPSGINSYNYTTGQTVAPQPGDNSLFYNGYGTTVASITTASDSSWNSLAAGTFRAQTLQWTCPAADAGMPLDVMFIFHCGPEQVSLDNVQLQDLTANPIIPTSPTALSATAVSSSQVNLSWTDTAGDETGFRIDRSSSSDFTQNLTSFTTTGTTTSYSDTSASPGTTYYYRVYGVNNGTLSTSPTNTSNVTTVAGPFTVPNFSFENPAQANGAYSNNILTNWTIGAGTTNDTAGVQNNTGSSYVNSVPDGSQFAYLNANANNTGYNSSNTLTSTVLGTVSGSQTYTLTVAIGNRLDSPLANNGTYTISLLDGGTVLASQTYSGSSITPGTWYDLTLAYTTASNVATGSLQVQLGFSTTGYTAGNAAGQGDFDNVRLTTVTTTTAPAAPSGLTATDISGTQINLAWTDNSNNESGFKIDQATDSGFTQNLSTVTVSANTTTYNATGLSPNTTYYYRVRATNSIGDSTNTSTATATTLNTPLAPSALTATAASSSQINLSWTDNSNNETGFKIDQATSSDFTQNLTTVTVGANVTTYNATGLSASTTYYYRVRATNASGDSTNTSTANATTQGVVPAAPSGLTATAASSSQINLSWTDNSNNETGFKIDQSTSSDFSQNLTTVTVGANVTTYNASGLTATTTYYYRVRATNAVGDSTNTSTANATTLAGASATFVAFDTTTQGNWVNSGYGADGYNVIGDTTSYPSYATVSVTGNSSYTWAASTSDIRALQKASNHSDRIASGWYTTSSMDITIDVTGGLRQVALYFLDWDNSGRVGSVNAYDANSGATLMPQQTISSYGNGEYLLLNLTGDVRLHYSFVSGSYGNTVVNGLFFSTVSVTPPAAPSGLTATAVSGGQINLNWTDNSNNETGFKIDRATDSGFTQNVSEVTVGANTTSYSSTGLTPNTTYYYRVRATNSYGDSSNTSTANATTTSTAVITVPDAGFEQATAGEFTSANAGTLTSPVTATIPGWNVTINPTTYAQPSDPAGTYNGYAPFAQIFPSDPSSGDYMASDEGSQHLSFNGGELFNNYPWEFGWPGYGIMTGQSDQIASAATLATSIAGATYTATIAVADPLWQTVSHQTFAQEVAAAAYEGNPTAAQVAASGVWIATPQFELDIVANGHVVGSATLAAATLSSTEAGTQAAAGQWYTLTATWTAPTSGQNITLQASASQIAEGAYNLGHTIDSAEGPDLFTSTCASFDNAGLIVTTPVGIPTAPSGLTATAASSSQINLSWTDNSNNESGFIIDQSTSSDFTQNLTTVTVGANVTTYNATGLSAATTYYYRVRATNNNGDSAETSTANATTQGVPPTTPSGLTATTASSSQINLSWADTAGDETGFQIDQATSSDFTQNLTTVSVGVVTTYNATGLTSGTTYYYRIRATNGAGSSANTSSANATTTTVVTQPVSVPNYSFENPAQASGGYSTNVVTNWTVGVNAGVQNNISAYFGSVPDGVQFAYINAQSGQTNDTLTSAVLGTTAPSQTYTLTVAIGNRLDTPFANNGTFTISLLDGGTVLNSATYAGSSITPGAWHDLPLVVVTPSNVANGNLQIQLAFSTPGYTSGSTFGQGDFDNVRLTQIAPTQAPTAPSNLTATPVVNNAASVSNIGLSWTNNANSQTGFKIDQSTSSDFSQNLTTVTVGANATTYTATGLAAGTTYYYRVRATNSLGDSANSNTASATAQTVIPVPDGDFSADAPNPYINPGSWSTGSGSGTTITSPMTATLAGWNVVADPTTANGGLYEQGGWIPYGLVENITNGGNATPFGSVTINSIGNQPASSYQAFLYYPGEQYSFGSVVTGPQPGANLTMTTTGITANSVAGTTYTASIDYANVSMSNAGDNASANVELDILANGVVVGTGTLSGLAQNSPWTPITATWTATTAGQALQLRVVATNFLEGGPAGPNSQFQVPTFAFANATLTSIVGVGLPSWLSSNSSATWNSTSHSLVVTGPTTIIADPGTAEPLITANGAAAVVTVNTGSTAAVNIGSVTLTNGASLVASDASVSQVLVVAPGANNLGIDATSTFDLGKNYLDLQNSGGNIAAIDTLLHRGFGNGTWNGTGLTSSDAHNDASFLTAVGSIVNGGQFNSGNKFNGVIPGANDILIHRTYYGNADLTGTVNGNDYSLIDAGFGSGGTLKGWQNGDFNYDGVIDGSDYSLIDNAFNQQSATPLAEVAAPTAPAAKPAMVASPAAAVAAPSLSSGSQLPFASGSTISDLLSTGSSTSDDLIKNNTGRNRHR